MCFFFLSRLENSAVMISISIFSSHIHCANKGKIISLSAVTGIDLCFTSWGCWPFISKNISAPVKHTDAHMLTQKWWRAWKRCSFTLLYKSHSSRHGYTISVCQQADRGCCASLWQRVCVFCLASAIRVKWVFNEVPVCFDALQIFFKS